MSTYTIQYFRAARALDEGVELEEVGAMIDGAYFDTFDSGAEYDRLSRAGFVLQDMLAQQYPTADMERYLGIRITADPAELPPESGLPPA